MKAELLEYYAAVAPLMLPPLANRPSTLVRFPDGVNEQQWVAKAPPPGMPAGEPPAVVPRQAGAARQIMVGSTTALVRAANLTDEFHTLCSGEGARGVDAMACGPGLLD